MYLRLAMIVTINNILAAKMGMAGGACEKVTSAFGLDCGNRKGTAVSSTYNWLFTI